MTLSYYLSLKRFVFFYALVICSIFQVQGQNWQHYGSLFNIEKTLELEDLFYVQTHNALIVIDKDNLKAEAISFKAIGFEFYCRAICEGPQGQVLFVGDGNKIIEQTADGTYEQWPNVLQEEDTVYDILAYTAEGEVILLLSNKNVVVVDKQGNYRVLLVEAGALMSIRGGLLTDQGVLWVWDVTNMCAYNMEGEMLDYKHFQHDYISNVFVEQNNDLIVVKDVGLAYYHQLDQTWHQTTYQNLGVEPTNYAAVQMNKGVLLPTLENDYVHIYFENGAFAKKTVMLPASYSIGVSTYVDEQGGFLFFDYSLLEFVYWKGQKLKHLNIENAICLNGLNTIKEDPDGNIWIGGREGLATWMGGQWNTRKLPSDMFSSNVIKDMGFTHKGRLVLGMSLLNFFATTESQLLIEKTNGWDTLHQAFVNPSFFSLTDAKIDQEQNIWVLRAGDQEFSVYSNGEWHRFFLDDMPVDLTIFNTLELAPDGTMWIGTDNGILTYDGYRFEHISPSDLLAENGNVIQLSFDNKGRAWAALGIEGIRLLDGDRCTAYGQEDLPAEANTVYFIEKGVGDEMWALSYGQHLLHFDGQVWTINNMLQEEGFSNAGVLEIITDSKNRVWFLKYDGVSVLHPDEEDTPLFELKEAENLRLMPNPTLGRFQLHWQQAVAGKVAVHIVNNLGQVVKQWHYGQYGIGEHDRIIDRPNLSPALYYVQLYINDELLATQPLLIAR